MLWMSAESSNFIAVKRSNASCACACRYARSSASVRPSYVTTLPASSNDELAHQVPVEPRQAVVVDDQLGERFPARLPTPLPFQSMWFVARNVRWIHVQSALLVRDVGLQPPVAGRRVVGASGVLRCREGAVGALVHDRLRGVVVGDRVAAVPRDDRVDARVALIAERRGRTLRVTDDRDATRDRPRHRSRRTRPTPASP